MSKFRIKMKLQGLELEVEGTREDAPMIAQQLGQQFVGLLQPAAVLASGQSDAQDDSDGKGAEAVTITAPAGAVPAQRKSRRRRASTNGKGSASATTASLATKAVEEPVSWRHDTEHWGAPQQTWSTAQKAIWLLYVAGENTSTKEQSSGQIVATYTKHFRSAGHILKGNVTRDLGRMKNGKEAKVSEDTTGVVPLWYLTNSGVAYARSLVAEATGGPRAEAAAEGNDSGDEVEA